MAHFYECNGDDPIFREDVSTPAQARKAGSKVYPSVTTVLSVLKDPFIDGRWRPEQLVRLARENPHLVWQDVERLTYGTRTHPETGETIPSSDFGTAVHAEIEGLINEVIGHGAYQKTAYYPWAKTFVDWVSNNGIQPVACEHIVSCSRIKTAGSVDFIGYDADGNLFLADYKCRTNTKGKAKTYSKDCQQIAVEALMLSKRLRLDYFPDCLSVIIDCDTKEHMHKWWSLEERQKGADMARSLARIYWKDRMK